MPDTILPPESHGTPQLVGGVYGGNQPITAAHVYIFEANSGTGYGVTPPTSLLGNTDPVYAPTGCNSTVTLPLVWDGTQCYYQTGGTNYAGSNNPVDSNPGEFQLTGLYSCTPGDNVWLLSLSGYPTTPTGSGSTLNPYAGLMAALGQCPTGGNFSADQFIYMNELSTVAMAYAIAPFAAKTTGSNYGTNMLISAPTTNVLGFNQAFNNAIQLYNIFGTNDPADRSAPHTTLSGPGIPPYYLINTLGDVLASCINTSGDYPAGNISTNCSELFTDVYGGTSIQTDTASAALAIAQDAATLPPTNVTGLLSLSTSASPWQPNNTSSGAPYGGLYPEFSVAIAYTPVTGLTVDGVALDASGDVFTNVFETTGYTVKLTQNSSGSVVVTNDHTLSPKLNDAGALAIDSASPGNIWSTGAQGTSGHLYETANDSAFTSVASIDSSPLSSSESLADPIAADKLGYVYIADPSLGSGPAGEIVVTNGGADTKIKASTAPLSTYGCVAGATGVAVDPNGALWVTGTGGGIIPGSVVCHINTTGTVIYSKSTNQVIRGGPNAISEADAVAVDSSNNGWTVSYSGNTVQYLSPTTSVASPTYTDDGAVAAPVAIAIDGNNNVWILNYSNNAVLSNGDTLIGGSIAELSHTGSPLTLGSGIQAGNLSAPTGIAIDISGNVWVANTDDQSLVEVIGIATPTVNPLSALKPGQEP
jgi:sugar lactone lactonase YvrE